MPACDELDYSYCLPVLMAEQTKHGPDERILGAVTIEPGDLQHAGAEATGESRIYEALQWAGLAFALAGFALNLSDGSSSHSHMLSYLIISFAIFAIIAGRLQRAQRANAVRKRITDIHRGEAQAVQYELGPSSLEMQCGSSSISYAWSACQGFGERRHTFLLYFDRTVPDVVFKRAFRDEDLSRVRELLGTHVKNLLPKRTSTRSVLLALLLGFAILALAIIAALVAKPR